MSPWAGSRRISRCAGGGAVRGRGDGFCLRRRWPDGRGIRRNACAIRFHLLAVRAGVVTMSSGQRSMNRTLRSSSRSVSDAVASPVWGVSSLLISVSTDSAGPSPRCLKYCSPVIGSAPVSVWVCVLCVSSAGCGAGVSVACSGSGDGAVWGSRPGRLMPCLRQYRPTAIFSLDSSASHPWSTAML